MRTGSIAGMGVAENVNDDYKALCVGIAGGISSIKREEMEGGRAAIFHEIHHRRYCRLARLV
jgi:hypothetical protein